MGVTKQLAEFLVKTRFADLPKETVDRAKELILDFIGVSLGGCRTSLGELVMEHVKNMDARAEAGVIGGKFKTTAAYAAYVNAALNHVLELETVGSLGPNIAQSIAVALALGEKLGLSGKKVIEGLVLGRELHGRVCEGAMAGPGQRGLGLAANHVGGVAVASKMLGLNVDQTRAALGICLEEASGMNAQFGYTAHQLLFSRPAYSGVQAAEYAKEGLLGNPDMLETPQGFCDQYAGVGECNFEVMTKELGRVHTILPPGTSIKKYPCCFISHPALDATLDLLKEHNIAYQDIKSVQLDVPGGALFGMRHSEPVTEYEARFSFQHVLGTAILEKKVWLESFTLSSVTSQRFREARGKVKVIAHPEWPRGLRGSVTIQLKDGKTYSKETATTRELSMEEVLMRYRQLAQPILSSSDISRSIEMIENLEKLDNVSQLMALVTG